MHFSVVSQPHLNNSNGYLNCTILQLKSNLFFKRHQLAVHKDMRKKEGGDDLVLCFGPTARAEMAKPLPGGKEVPAKTFSSAS